MNRECPETKKEIKKLMKEIDIMKRDFNKVLRNGNKTAAQRIRVITISLARMFKKFRIASLKELHRG